MTVAPAPHNPEKFRNSVFERVTAPSITGNKGDVHFYEGVATETGVPQDFQVGAVSDTTGTPRGYQTVETFYKRAEKTVAERAHIGSASWIEAPQLLSDFVSGTQSGDRGTMEGGWERAFNSGGYQKRPSAVRVSG